MAPKPSTLPRWATGAGRTVTPPASGGSTVICQDNGWVAGKRPPARFMNWLDNLRYQWIQYLDTYENNQHTWTESQTYQTATLNGTTITASGNGTGYAIEAIGTGNTQAAIRARGLVFGAGIWGTGAGSSAGGRFEGGSGGGPGILATAGTGGAAGVQGTGAPGGNSYGVLGTGTGTNAGGWFAGGPTGAGVVATGGSTSGPGVQATGTGGWAGVVATGGPVDGAPGVQGTGGTGGAGGTFLGNGPAAGVFGQGGASGGPGVIAQGGSGGGPGLVASGNGGDVAVQVGTGNMRFTGTAPAKDADPGYNSVVSGANICSARLTYRYTSAGTSDADRIRDGFNIASVVTSGSLVSVTFARPMANADYTLDLHLVNTSTGGPSMWMRDILNKTVNGFDVRLSVLEFATGDTITQSWNGSQGFDAVIFGRQ